MIKKIRDLPPPIPACSHPVWSEGWQAKRGLPFSPEEMVALRRFVKAHLDEVTRKCQEHETGKQKYKMEDMIPRSDYVLVDRIFSTVDKVIGG